jgi:hypothetical protein
MYQTRLLAAIELDGIRATGYGFLIELKYKALLKSECHAEIPIHFADRTLGKSKIPGSTIFKNFWLVFKLGDCAKNIDETTGPSASPREADDPGGVSGIS